MSNISDLVWQYVRVIALTIILAGVPILIVGFTVLPSLSSLQAELISCACGIGGVVAAWTIELVFFARR